MTEQGVGDHVEDDGGNRAERGESQPENSQQTNVLTHPAAPWKPDARRSCEFLSALAAETLVGLYRAAAFITEHVSSWCSHTSTTSRDELQAANVPANVCAGHEAGGDKRKGHPAKGGHVFQGRIVPTEIRPSKLSGEIL